MAARGHWCALLLLLAGLHVSDSSSMSRYKRLLMDRTHDVPSNRLRNEYDFIVVGSGPGGATVANRLTEVPTWNVLLLEAGGEELGLGQIPMMTNLLQRTPYNWDYSTEPEANACLGMVEGRCRWPRGKGMGGTSLLSNVLYTRGHPQDYDDWAEAGNPGWGWDDVFKYFLKSENIQGDMVRSRFHSRGGYLDVDRPYLTPLALAFLRSGKEIGYPIIDYNSGEQIGFSLAQVMLRNGSRCTANRAFLRPIRNRKNLHVAKQARVTRVLIDRSKKQAVGVEFYRDGRYFRAKARKEVILSAGALNSPQLLMLSGIGPRNHLKSLGIPVVHDLSGVGLNLQDHVGMGGLAFLVNETVTLLPNRLLKPSLFVDYYVHGRGPLTSPLGMMGLSFVRTPISDKAFDYPDIELQFMGTTIASDNGGIKQNLGVRDDIYNKVYAPIHGRDAWSAWPVLLKPKSRGWMKLKSKNPFQKPLFHANYFQDEHDLLTVVEGIKLAVRLSKTRAFRKFNSTLHDIPLPPCKGYIFASDDYWRCVAQQFTMPGNHQCCTAKMGLVTDPLAVVDPELMVHGIHGLRIVDASVMPSITTAHTMAPTFMIGEKAADMIKRANGFLH